MNSKNQTLNLVLLLFGGGFLIYDLTGENDNVYLKIIALAMLMFGLYRTTQSWISSDLENQKSFIDEENQ